MDLLSRLDKAILRAEVRQEGLLESISHLFEGSVEEQIKKVNQWRELTTSEVRSLDEFATGLQTLAENVSTERTDELLIRSLEATRQAELKRHLIEVVDNKLRYLTRPVHFVPVDLSIPKRKRIEPMSGDLGSDFSRRLGLI